MSNSSLATQLGACSLTTFEAEDLSRKVGELATSRQPSDAWSAVANQLLHPYLPPAVYPCIFQWVYRNWNSCHGPDPAWIPRQEEVDRTNIGHILKEVGLTTYAELYQWSIDHRPEYWEYMVRRLGIKLHRNYNQVLDATAFSPTAQWLSGATLNIAESCFQAPDDAIAIRQGSIDGEICDWTYGV